MEMSGAADCLGCPLKAYCSTGFHGECFELTPESEIFEILEMTCEIGTEYKDVCHA